MNTIASFIRVMLTAALWEPMLTTARSCFSFLPCWARGQELKGWLHTQWHVLQPVLVINTYFFNYILRNREEKKKEIHSRDMEHGRRASASLEVSGQGPFSTPHGIIRMEGTHKEHAGAQTRDVRPAVPGLFKRNGCSTAEETESAPVLEPQVDMTWYWVFNTHFSCCSMHLLPPCGQCKEWMTESQRQCTDLPISDLFHLRWVTYLPSPWLLGIDVLLTWPLYNSFSTSSLHFLTFGKCFKNTYSGTLV